MSRAFGVGKQQTKALVVLFTPSFFPLDLPFSFPVLGRAVEAVLRKQLHWEDWAKVRLEAHMGPSE